MTHVATDIAKRRVFDDWEKESPPTPPAGLPASLMFLVPLPLCPFPKYSERARLYEEGKVITSEEDSMNDIVYLVLIFWMLHSLFARVVAEAVNKWKPSLWRYEIIKLLPEKREALKKLRQSVTSYRVPVIVHGCCVLLASAHFLSRWLRQTSRTAVAADVASSSFDLLLLLLCMVQSFAAFGMRADSHPLAMDGGVLLVSLAALAARDAEKAKGDTQLSFFAAYPYTVFIPLTAKCFLWLHTFLSVMSQRSRPTPSTPKVNLKLFAFLKVLKINCVILHTLASTSMMKSELKRGCSNEDVRPLWFKFLEMCFFFVAHDVFLGQEESFPPEPESPTETKAATSTKNTSDGKKKKE